jgi:hypothetical protein
MADPSAAELSTLNDLAAVYDWAGVDEELRGTLASALGMPTKIRDMVFVNRATWDLTVGALTLPGATATDPRVPVPPVHQRTVGGRQACVSFALWHACGYTGVVFRFFIFWSWRDVFGGGRAASGHGSRQSGKQETTSLFGCRPDAGCRCGAAGSAGYSGYVFGL